MGNALYTFGDANKAGEYDITSGKLPNEVSYPNTWLGGLTAGSDIVQTIEDGYLHVYGSIGAASYAREPASITQNEFKTITIDAKHNSSGLAASLIRTLIIDDVKASVVTFERSGIITYSSTNGYLTISTSNNFLNRFQATVTVSQAEMKIYLGEVLISTIPYSSLAGKGTLGNSVGFACSTQDVGYLDINVYGISYIVGTGQTNRIRNVKYLVDPIARGRAMKRKTSTGIGRVNL